MRDNIICDLDGTIALDTGRAIECLHSGKRDWDAYYARCHEDEPNRKLIAMIQLLHQMEFHIWILSGRRADTLAVTEDWLKTHEVPYHQMLLRPTGDFTDDHLMKPQMAEAWGLTPENVLCVFEDRDRVVKAWRALGFLCLQVAPGDF